MLNSSYPSVEPVLPGTREGLDMQETSDLDRATRKTPLYPLGLRWGVQDAGIHHYTMDMNGGIAHSNGLVHTRSMIAVGT